MRQKKILLQELLKKIRAELLEDGEISEDVIALTALMDKAGNLKDCFSKYEQKELKDKIEAIKKSESRNALAKEMIEHIDALTVAAIVLRYSLPFNGGIDMSRQRSMEVIENLNM